MEIGTYKVLTIVLAILLILETSFIVWSVIEYRKAEDNKKDCYYNFCSDSLDANWYETGYCECLETDPYTGSEYVSKVRTY